MMNPLRSDTDTTTIVPLFMKITTDMLKLRLIGLTLLAFSAATAVHAEEKRYVSDELNTWVRSGPGDNYRLVGTVNAGEEVTCCKLTQTPITVRFVTALAAPHGSR